jgi:hypothetical protein
MTKEEQGFLATWFEDYIDQFRDQDGVLHSIQELKRCHSLQVARNASFIAAVLKLPEAEQRLAEGAGLVHDLGRFSQFAQQSSFQDYDSMDHGAEGRRVLETQDQPLLQDPGDWEKLLYVVEFHNKNSLDIPRGFSHERDCLLRLIRDADKLDIMEIVLCGIASDGFCNLPSMLPRICLCRDISPEVLKEAQNLKSVSSKNLSTLADFLVMIATWFYDLNYLPTLELAFQRNILYRIQKELPDTKAVRSLFVDITNTIFKTGEITQKTIYKLYNSI